ncbi:MAG: hypothetical protein ABI831_06070 [Betaproteobacteria bacterium]
MADERELIAQAAAALIIEHGIGDWQFARRKAARQLGLDDHVAMPDRPQLEAALRDYVQLYLGDEQAGLLEGVEDEALVWMEALSEFDPQLTGPVAEGWVYPGCEIRIELLADDAKIVEIALLDQGIAIRHLNQRESANVPTCLQAEGETGPVRLIVQDVSLRRNRKRDRVRIGVEELRGKLLP